MPNEHELRRAGALDIVRHVKPQRIGTGYVMLEPDGRRIGRISRLLLLRVLEDELRGTYGADPAVVAASLARSWVRSGVPS